MEKQLDSGGRQSDDLRLQARVVGDKGQIQADPSHNGAVRRMTGQGLKYSDLLGIAPTGGRGWAALFSNPSLNLSTPCSTVPHAGRRRGRTSNDPCAGGDRTVSGIWPSGGPLSIMKCSKFGRCVDTNHKGRLPYSTAKRRFGMGLTEWFGLAGNGALVTGARPRLGPRNGAGFGGKLARM